MMCRRLGCLLGLCFAGAAAWAQGVTLPDATRIELDNGAVLVLSEKHDVPLIGVEAIIRGGAVADPAGKSGLASLLASVMEKGAGDRDASQFAEAIDSVGAVLSIGADLEAIRISGEFMSRDADLMIGLLGDLLRRPRLEASEMVGLRDRQINQIRAAKDGDPRWLMNIYGNGFLFADHPYGTPQIGSEESLARIRHADLTSYYRDHVGADRLIVAIVGDFDASVMAEKLRAVFEDWEPANAALPDIGAAEPVSGRRVLLIDKPGSTQSYFWVGNVGIAVDYARRAEFDIADTLFGGRMTSLLQSELRTKGGLTYGARTYVRRPSRPGSIAISSFTKTESTMTAIDLALVLLEKMRAEGFDEETIASGKNYILGLFPQRLETGAQLAAQFAELEAYGLDDSHINAYGAAIAAADGETIQDVITSVYPAADNLVFVILGDAQAIREDVAKYGAVTEMSMRAPRFRPSLDESAVTAN
ncbi:MAG: M16 family metallopeptidase [Woeseiaceae bacterium]|jgi:zinc protease